MKVDQEDKEDRHLVKQYKAGYRLRANTPRHKQVLQDFVNESRDWLDRHPNSTRDSLFYMAQPFRECGYAGHFFRREGQHFDGSSSNIIMQLLNAIAHSHDHGNFVFRAQPVFQCYTSSQAALAEIVITALSSSKPSHGHGCSWFPAGDSVASSKKVPDWAWPLFEEEAWERWEMDKNLKAEEVLMFNTQKAIPELEDRIKKLEKEAEQDEIKMLELKLERLQMEERIYKAHVKFCQSGDEE